MVSIAADKAAVEKALAGLDVANASIHNAVESHLLAVREIAAASASPVRTANSNSANSANSNNDDEQQTAQIEALQRRIAQLESEKQVIVGTKEDQLSQYSKIVTKQKEELTWPNNRF